MYKFTNGIVCYDAATKNKYVEAGMTLIKEEPKKEEKNAENSKKKRYYRFKIIGFLRFVDCFGRFIRNKRQSEDKRRTAISNLFPDA